MLKCILFDYYEKLQLKTVELPCKPNSGEVISIGDELYKILGVQYDIDDEYYDIDDESKVEITLFVKDLNNLDDDGWF